METDKWELARIFGRLCAEKDEGRIMTETLEQCNKMNPELVVATFEGFADTFPQPNEYNMIDNLLEDIEEWREDNL